MEEKPIQTHRKPLLKALMNVGVIVLGMATIYFGFIVVLGSTTPFFVVSSGSMVPNLEIGDIIVVSGNTGFEDLKVGDIVVFEQPSQGSKVIVHRVYEIYDSSTRSIVTKGDNNRTPDNWRVTAEDYIGQVVWSIPKIGYLTTALVPPMNYFVIVIVIATIFVLEIRSNRTEDDEDQQTKV